MKKVLFAVLLAALVIGNAAAIDVTFGTVPDSWGEALDDNVKQQIIDKVNDEYGKYEKGDKVGKAMSNANALAAGGGYMHSANGYDLFSVALSASIAGAASSLNDIKDFVDDFKDDGDIYLGVGGQIINAAVGFNVGKLFKWDHALYLTLKGGVAKFSYEDFDLNTYNLGFMVNYQLIEDKGGKHVKWRGLNVGAGYTYYSSKVEWSIDKLDSIDVNVGPGFTYNADLDVEVENTRHIIPVEITTGVKLSVIELFGGLGADFMFGGKSKISADSDAKVTLNGNDEPTDSKMHLSADGDKDNFKMKFLAGLGFSLGPVHIEIPYTQYFDEKINASVGVIGGVAF